MDGVISVTCKTGYKLLGPPSVLCIQGASLGHCILIQCMVPATDNGFIVPSVVNYGKKAYLRCNQGYKAEVSYTNRAIKLT